MSDSSQPHGLFSRPEQAFLFPGDVPNPGIESRSPTLQGILYQLSYEGSFIFGASKSLQMVAAAMKLKDACSLEEKL